MKKRVALGLAVMALLLSSCRPPTVPDAGRGWNQATWNASTWN